MEIIKAETAGFCFGVDCAVERAFKLAKETTEKLYTYGPLIHNPSVIESLENMGVQIVEDTEDERLKDATVLIRAHGVSPKVLSLIHI